MSKNTSVDFILLRRILQVAQMLIEEAKQQYIAFPLFTNDDIVFITDAGILDCKLNNRDYIHVKSVFVVLC